MAYKIVGSQCTGCSACEPECPNDAIYEKKWCVLHQARQMY